MRKTLAVIAAGAIAVTLLGAPSGAAPKQQKFEGSILLPARHPDGCYTGLQRHWTSITEGAINGVLGYTFEVEKGTWNKPFKLTATDGVGTIDLDVVYYYGEFATRDEFIADPAPAAPGSIGFEDHTSPDEAGKVPNGAIMAIICLYASEAGAAGNVSFSYAAGKGVK
ncbi:MAG: hypothetical protein ACRDI3_02175 [Actinomycetota bacterium]